MKKRAPPAGTIKRRLKAMLVSSMLVVSLLGGGMVSTAQALTTTSQSKVTFKDGDLKLIVDTAEGSGLHFDFGRHYLPVAAISYPAENVKPHLLTVEDGRINSGKWYVTVKMTSFTEESGSLIPPSFEATIKLKNPRMTADNGSVPIENTGLVYADDIEITSNLAPQMVMEAPDSLVRGKYTMQWDNKDVTLFIPDDQIWRLDLLVYTTLLSWQLVQGPR